MAADKKAIDWLVTGEWEPLPEDWVGPTIDHTYTGLWTASAFPPVGPNGDEPDPVEATGPTPVHALQALAAKLAVAA